MKLRNKKTGEIVEINTVDLVSTGQFMDKIIDRQPSLTKLNEEWEDYKPQEPLIEHDDAREAFFNWASANQVHRVKCVVYERNGVPITRFTSTEYISEPSIEFKLLDADVEDGRKYTTAELCGELES